MNETNRLGDTLEVKEVTTYRAVVTCINCNYKHEVHPKHGTTVSEYVVNTGLVCGNCRCNDAILRVVV